jgi:hypothetical protein
MEKQLSVGFARVNINPMRGVGIAGYFVPRVVEGILDDLHASAVAVSLGNTRTLLISLDLLQMKTYIANKYREAISKATGIPMAAIYIHCQHTHTAPYVDPDREDLVIGEYAPNERELILEYQNFVGQRLVDLSLKALEDLKAAKMGFGVGKASNIAFIRRFRMKDGSVRTNPGVNNPDIVAPIGELDERVSVVRFDREGATSVVIVNYADHPDVVGGSLVSADWPGFLCRTVEQAIDNTNCIFFNGAQGDVNHVNVHPTPGYLNDMFMDFDDVARGYGHARYMGRVVAGAVLQVYDKVQYVDVDSIKYIEKTMNVPSNMPEPERLEEAHRINNLHLEGRDDEIPFEGMLLTTAVAEAGRMVRLEHGPEYFPMSFTAISIGKVAFFGIPGEPFNGIGKALKETEGFELIIPSCLVNGSEGYFPMKDAYDEGGYEAKSSNFKAGVAEFIIDEGKKMITELAKL